MYVSLPWFGLLTILTYTHTEHAKKSTCLFNAGFCQPMCTPSLMLKEYCVVSKSRIEKNHYCLKPCVFVTHLDVCLRKNFCLFPNVL